MPRNPVNSWLRGVAETVVADLVCEDALVVDVGLHRAYLVDDESWRRSSRRRRVGDKLRAEQRAEQPDAAEAGDSADRPAAVVSRDAEQPKHRQGHENEENDGEASRR